MTPTAEANLQPSNPQPSEPIIYQGQFGEFTITAHDRQEVRIYRSGLMVSAVCFAIAVAFVSWQGTNPLVIHLVSLLYIILCVGLGISLWTIHIYMKSLHQTLQAFWAIGVGASLAIAIASPSPLALTVYQYPLTILGIGFVFAALTGIFFKEAFCFNRLETKLLTPLVPTLLLGHLLGFLSLQAEQLFLISWAILFLVFAIRKVIQPIPPDIGDKSVFEYLRQSHQA
jgi:uncharacterized integral membrane protein